MPGALPLGDPAPADGVLPASTAHGAGERDFGVYLHVPFCRVRCGYCDFNTYTATELRGVSQSEYAGHAVREVRFAQEVLERSGVPAREVSTVFFGGGTPTLLPAQDLAAVVAAIDAEFGLAPSEESLESARSKLPPDPYVVVNPGAGWETKRWPIASVANFCRRMSAEGIRTVLVGSASSDEQSISQVF